MSRQTTSAFVVLHSSAVSLPGPADPSEEAYGADVTELLDSDGYGSGKLEFWIEATTSITLTNVRVWLREDVWGVAAQAGSSDRAFDSLPLQAGFPARFVVADSGRPTRAGVEATYAGTVTVRVRRVDDL